MTIAFIPINCCRYVFYGQKGSNQALALIWRQSHWSHIKPDIALSVAQQLRNLIIFDSGLELKMSTNVTIIDILGALHRWNPLDVKQLFGKEFVEEMEFREKVIQELIQKSEDTNASAAIRRLFHMSVKIYSLAKTNQFIRRTNSELYLQGKEAIGELKSKIRRLEKELADARHEPRQSLVEAFDKTNSICEQNTDLNNECPSDSSSAQSLGVSERPGNEKIKEKDESISGRHRRLSQALVSKIIELKSENSKLKQQIKQKCDSICESDKVVEEVLDNELMEAADDNGFETFLQRFLTNYSDDWLLAHKLT